MTPQQALVEAVKLHQAGRFAEADALYGRVLAIMPNHVDALHLSGMLASQTGRHERAVALIGRAITLSQGRPVAAFHNNIGLAYRGLGRLDDAIAQFRRAVAHDARYADAYCNLAGALKARGQREEAIAAYRGALAIKPAYPEAHNNLGGLLRDRGRLPEAIAQYRQAIALRPNYADAYVNLGMALHEQDEIEPAIACYRQALALKPDDPPAHVNLAMAQLALGDFAAGWPEYEWRHRMPWVTPRHFVQPTWTGGPLACRTILLHAEQGFGDTLQFARYASLVARLGARVVLEVPRPLVDLMRSLDGVAAVHAEGEALPDFDVQSPLMSLPRALGTRVDTIPGKIPYLSADPARTAAWAARLATLPRGLKIGLVWAGAPRPFHAEADAIDRNRSIRLERLGGLMAIPGVTFISLQKGEPAAELKSAPIGRAIRNWTDALHDFADTAALIQGLDLVIGVDTAVVHLAGALGKPVWMLNRFDSCWRWLRGRNDSPWYPTLRQFRQTAPGDWDPVIDAVARALAMLAPEAKKRGG